jgi:chromosome segregation ATPase
MDEPSHWQILVWNVSASFSGFLLLSGLFTTVIWKMFGRSINDIEERRKSLEESVRSIKADLAIIISDVKTDLTSRLDAFHEEMRQITGDHVHLRAFSDLSSAVDVIRNKQGENTGILTVLTAQIGRLEERVDRLHSGHHDAREHDGG